MKDINEKPRYLNFCFFFCVFMRANLLTFTVCFITIGWQTKTYISIKYHREKEQLAIKEKMVEKFLILD